ncbi:bola protein [Radiomyces spectabilis]|uniref:bola protein n=1 Tax=Radiomyces spectabilis TaxID=64574 RepID=UPI00222065A2|nr:bola protein [Radiomyces spectabilis]KAI8394024.1 bola protein [Radiomyces spectabilis]
MTTAARLSATRSFALPSVTGRSMLMQRYSTETNDEVASLSEGERLIYNKLTDSLEPHRLRVMDVSGGCGSMYAIDIASKQFEGVSIVKQHRMVNAVLKDEIKGMHGLQLRTSSK